MKLDVSGLNLIIVLQDKDGNHYAAAMEKEKFEAIQFIVMQSLHTVVPISEFKLELKASDNE